MNDTHLKHTHSPYHLHTLRPVVIAVTAAIGISGLLVGCGGGSNGGGNKGNNLITSGGNGGKTTGYGGSGGYVSLYALAADTVIEVLTNAKNKPDTSDIPESSTGTDALIVDAADLQERASGADGAQAGAEDNAPLALWSKARTSTASGAPGANSKNFW